MADVILNLLLFIPLGAGLSHAGLTWRRAMVAGVGLTLGVEILQILLPGRHPSLWDVLANTAGAGAGLYLSSFRQRSRAEGLLLVAGALLIGGGHFSLVSRLLVPWPSAAPTYVGLIDHVFPTDVPFVGTVVDATFDGRPIEYATLPFRDGIERAFLAGEFQSILHLEGAQPTPGHALVVGIADGSKYLMAHALEGCRFLFGVRMLAAERGFAFPGVKVDYPCEELGGAVELRADVTRDVIRYTVGGSQTSASASLDLSPGLGWTMLVPGTAHYTSTRPLTIAWLAGLSAVLAGLAACVMERGQAVTLTSVVLLIGFAAAGGLTPASTLALECGLALVVGSFVGACGFSWWRRHGPSPLSLGPSRHS